VSARDCPPRRRRFRAGGDVRSAAEAIVLIVLELFFSKQHPERTARGMLTALVDITSRIRGSKLPSHSPNELLLDRWLRRSNLISSWFMAIFWFAQRSHGVPVNQTDG
jgi:hypothetical protein